MPVDLKRVSRDTFYVVVFTTLTTLVWVGLEVFRSLTGRATTKVSQQQLEPLPRELSRGVLNSLRQGSHFQEEQWQNLPIPSPSDNVTESTKSVSMELAPVPTATVGGGVQP